MVNVAVADKYSLALYELALEKNQVETILAQLKNVAADFANNPLLTETFQSKKVTGNEKKEILMDILDKQGASELLKEFFAVLLQSNRGLYIVNVYKSFLDRYQKQQGIKNGVFTTPVGISEEEKKSLEERFSKTFNCHMTLDVKVDPEIIGGAILEVDGVVYKDDLDSRVNRLRKWMKG